MRKFIFTASVIAIISLVPAVLLGYLHDDKNGTENKPATETVSSDVTNGQDDGYTLHLVKNF